MKAISLHKELVCVLQNFTGNKSESLISLYFALDKSKAREDIVYLLKKITFDEEANMENILPDSSTYIKLLNYFKNLG